MSRYIALRRIQIIVAIMMVLGVFIGAPATQAAPNAQVGIIPTDSISCDDYTIVANSSYDAENNTTRFSYAVTTLADADHDLSHWDLSLETCVAEDDIVGASHDSKFGTDPTTDVSGIKFDIEVLKGDTVNFWFDLAGYWPETMATAAIKASNAFCFKETIGPSCQMPSFYGIAGQKWHDVNGNGSPDNGESFLPGWTIQLQHPTGAISTTVTGDFGYYAFSGLPAGAYTVTEVLQSGWHQTYPAGGKHVIVLPQDETGDGIASDKDFGNHQLGSLNVTKVVDWGEVTPDTGQTFEICVAGPSFSEPNCQIADYDGGTLAWTDLIPGQYTVTETNPGAEWTVAGSGVDVTVPAGGSGSVTVTNSIDQPVYGSILVRKVTVPSDDSTEFPFTFESDGFALKDGESELFGGLVVGTYDIAELVPEGWDLIGVQCVEVQPTLSDDLPTFVYNANGVAVTLGAGDHAMCTFTNTEHIDLPDYDLSGFKWHDENGNGVWDDGEPGLAGWEITLMSGDLVLKTTTAADGSYVFTNLPPGAYTVAETQQPGWTQTFPADKGGKHSVTIADADVTGKNFGNRVPETPLYNLSGFKWEDMDGDGAWDSGEPGLAGWTITLEDEAGATKTTITGAGGAYAFTGLAAGKYTVSESLKSGWTQTFPAGDGRHNVVLGEKSVSNVNFGNYRPIAQPPTPEPCTRADVSVVVYAGWNNIPVKAWVGGAEQPTLYTAVDGFGQQQVMWTFYPPANARWNVTVQPQTPDGMDAARWQYRLLRVESPSAGTSNNSPSAATVSISRCNQYVLYFQLVDLGTTPDVAPTPPSNPGLPVTGGGTGPIVAGGLGLFAALTGLGWSLRRRT